ncbi:MAG TPA: DMT family transporter [Candidatus Limnocylindrales bacterium]|nr:DMT family transporter [Candidatus Limnocylindrales bacterium]
MTHPSTPRERRIAEIGVLVVVLCWAANFVIVKAAIADVPALVFTGIRYVLASGSLLLLLRLRTGSMLIPRRDLGVALLLGALGFGVYQVLWISGLRTITAGESALLVATSPVIVALVAAAIGVESLSVGRSLGVLVSFAGVALVIGAGGDLALGASLGGELLTLGGTVAWSAYTAFTAKAMRRIDAVPLTAWAVVGGTLVVVPLAAWEAATGPAFSLGPASLAAIAYSGILAAGLANVLIAHGVRLVGPTTVTVLQYGVPPLAVVLGAVFLREEILPGHVLGGLVIVLGVVLMRAAGASRPRAGGAAVPR